MDNAADKGSKKPTEQATDDDLDDALEATFPASDAVHVDTKHSNQPDRPVDRRPADIDKAAVEQLAEEVGKKQPSVKHRR